MNKIELSKKIKNFTDHKTELVLEIFFVLKKEAGDLIKRADIESESQLELRDDFIRKLDERIVSNEELSVIPISNVDERKNVIYEYDFEETPKGLSFLNEIYTQEDFPLFSFKDDNLAEITGVIFLVHMNRSSLISYKRNYSINLYKQNSNGIPLVRWGDNNRLAKVSQDILKIYPDFDFFKLDDDLFISNINILERNFDFHKVIKDTASKSLDRIESANIIEDINSLKELAADISFARKLAKIGSHSPVLSRKVSAESIIDFVENHPGIEGSFIYNDDRTRIRLSTKKSKELFLKLMNDDFLQSRLTELHYETLAKEKVRV